MLDLIKLVLWDTGTVEVNQEIYKETQDQAISLLVTPVMSKLIMPPDIRGEWREHVLKLIIYNEMCLYAQKSLPLTVPYVILKGTEAAKYYPHPEYRMMGDIDIMTRREDLDKAKQELIADGYQTVKEDEREITLKKNAIEIDLHYYFASLNDKDQAKYMDDLIIDNINETHSLPDPINGLVLLEHISQHLEHGLGLRQIIDWMMFVNKCLPDEKWPEFRVIAAQTGMETLAIIATKMCEIYLGLPPRHWCENADKDLCKELLDYVLASGNFGSKRTDEYIGEEVFFGARDIKTTFKLLQARGKANWKAARKCALLRPVAWIYQAGRYVARGLKRDNASQKIKQERIAAKRKIRLLDRLGVKQTSKGLVIYKNGEYKKT